MKLCSKPLQRVVIRKASGLLHVQDPVRNDLIGAGYAVVVGNISETTSFNIYTYKSPTIPYIQWNHPIYTYTICLSLLTKLIFIPLLT